MKIVVVSIMGILIGFGTIGTFSRTSIAPSSQKWLTFEYQDGAFRDRETRSVWNILGHCLDGELRGRRLEAIGHGDFFAFAWLVFQPETEIYHP